MCVYVIIIYIAILLYAILFYATYKNYFSSENVLTMYLIVYKLQAKFDLGENLLIRRKG